MPRSRFGPQARLRRHPPLPVDVAAPPELRADRPGLGCPGARPLALPMGIAAATSVECDAPKGCGAFPRPPAADPCPSVEVHAITTRMRDAGRRDGPTGAVRTCRHRGTEHLGGVSRPSLDHEGLSAASDDVHGRHGPSGFVRRCSRSASLLSRRPALRHDSTGVVPIPAACP
jgi:hypothetical protein